MQRSPACREWVLRRKAMDWLSQHGARRCTARYIRACIYHCNVCDARHTIFERTAGWFVKFMQLLQCLPQTIKHHGIGQQSGLRVRVGGTSDVLLFVILVFKRYRSR
ncbi:hypothetical protein BAUCODRAFT_463076 [Baudoinia panamericana UAMH 10762]|uniref:Uncharacterized protein n=1 Tax=Baudoinia panamericana (strain UAMH 10762) TaxID=717646 RepID=M2N182_BAUPA|nr:uncharacterized protein BAUCODRAFT_463076 [Baudoinia panamericana UAMH 10762]EMC97698.1 hypothetical protein BAUCODRAFT_463076 [Baudoinia panamericana UAMH 10762]